VPPIGIETTTMIKRLKITGLNGNEGEDLDLRFFDDVNLLTGVNGSGKTTVLKVIWYLLSGNIRRLLTEVKFEDVTLETDSHFIRITDEGDEYNVETNVEVTDSLFGTVTIEQKIKRRRIDEGRETLPLRRLSTAIQHATGSSVFFPTFRRIEGGVLDRR